MHECETEVRSPTSPVPPVPPAQCFT
ncbi:rCG59328 [Rattus norvegicus]|uniref:RCG59328 n=1 Tax=Rattus norvegicus TaxID=10116 RepID=A6K7J0_RAT|nr:rCG59328 [Rattus norvegicus]